MDLVFTNLMKTDDRQLRGQLHDMQGVASTDLNGYERPTLVLTARPRLQNASTIVATSSSPTLRQCRPYSTCSLISQVPPAWRSVSVSGPARRGNDHPGSSARLSAQNFTSDSNTCQTKVPMAVYLRKNKTRRAKKIFELALLQLLAKKEGHTSYHSGTKMKAC